MSIGVIKWFNTDRGYGFIKPNDSDQDVFIHIKELQKANIGALTAIQLEGLWLEYETKTDNMNRKTAVNIKVDK
jgi:cold shock protein